MSGAEKEKLRCFHFKVVINKQKNKVLYAEAGSDFTDILFSFLLLPLGTIPKLLEAPLIGSLNTLYDGAVNLRGFHFHSEAAKQKLLALNPTSKENQCCNKLRFNINNPEYESSNSINKHYTGVFTKSTSSFIISDDLHVTPNMAGSFMEILRNLGIDVADMDGAETRNVAFGMKEILALLRVSLVSRNPLTALVLPESDMGSMSIISEQGNDAWSCCIDEKVESMNPKKMIVKAMIQKSTNKLLFAQANDDFVNFLFSLLTISLGRVWCVLGCNTILKNLDNLRRSIADISKNMHLNLKHAAGMLLFHPSMNEFSQLYFTLSQNKGHVKGARMYMVRDDLTVAQLDMSSCLSALNKMKISLSDVEEVELQVGLEEGLSILNAALTSTKALTNGLIKPKLKAPLSSKSALVDSSANQTQKKWPKLEC